MAANTMVDALLEQETRQQLNSSGSTTRLLNSAWRHKVVHWYFKLVGALRLQNTAASSNGTPRSSNPFNRTTVHISAHLLDNYLMSLPQEQAIRYQHNRQAYQLLATTCLLLGIRIAHHDAIKSLSNAQDVNESPAVEQQQQQSCGMKRAKKCTNISLMSAASTDSGPSPSIALPNVTTILSMSAAPNSITEQNVLDMVKKLASSRGFPRSKVVTTLDYIYALSGASSTQVSEDGQSISLGPQEVEEASRITDTLFLSDVNIVSTPPSVVACAIITLALSRSNTLNNLDMSSIRQKVYYSIFGSKVDPDLQIATLKAETTILDGVTAPPRHRRPVPITTHHIIPFD
eukprot:968726_1